MIKYWINSSAGWSQSLAVRFLKRTHTPLKKYMYLPNKLHKIENLAGRGGTCCIWCKPPDYAPIELDSMGAPQCHRQPDKSGKNNPTNKPRQTCFVCGKKGYISRE